MDMGRSNNLNQETLLKNFNKKVFKTDSCWLWMGKIRKDGYGVISINFKLVRAHRVAILLDNKKLHKGDKVMHTCDNPRCVNPSHLVVGTQKENMIDMINKDRNIWFKRGHLHPKSKFTKEDIFCIKTMITNKISQRQIASKFKCSQQTISKISQNKIYA